MDGSVCGKVPKENSLEGRHGSSSQMKNRTGSGKNYCPQAGQGSQLKFPGGPVIAEQAPEGMSYHPPTSWDLSGVPPASGGSRAGLLI